MQKIDRIYKKEPRIPNETYNKNLAEIDEESRHHIKTEYKRIEINMNKIKHYQNKFQKNWNKHWWWEPAINDQPEGNIYTLNSISLHN